MPKSPDAAPMDFGIWSILKRRLQRLKIYTMTGLKKALKAEWKNFEHSCTNRTFESWPRRCRMILLLSGIPD